MTAALHFPRRIAGIGLLALGSLIASAPPASAQTATAAGPDYSTYQTLLDHYVQTSSAAGEPIETVFDYTSLNRNPQHKKIFTTIRQQLFGVSPATLDDRERVAWTINAYNFLVIEAVTTHLFEPVQRLNKGGRRYYFSNRIATVNTIDLDNYAFFEGPVVEIEGESYSLNAFERKFAFRGFDHTSKAKPPAGFDPRVHFALVCASKGCPPLMPRAYRGDSLDQQLEFAVRNALASPRHLKFDPETKRLAASSIFQWYAGDFGGAEGALTFLKKYAPPATREAIEKAKVPWITTYILWDWNLNHPAGGNEKPWEIEQKAQEQDRSGE